MRVIPLPGKIGSPEFMTAYNAALAALNVREIGKTRSAPGTVSAAIAALTVPGVDLALPTSRTVIAARAALYAVMNSRLPGLPGSGISLVPRRRK